MPARSACRRFNRNTPNNEKFALIGVKIENSEDSFIISLYFNYAIDSESVTSRNILIDDEPVSVNTKFVFNKNRRMVRFNIEKKSEEFSLRIKNISSLDGRLMHQIEWDNLNTAIFLRYDRECGKWTKSSL